MTDLLFLGYELLVSLVPFWVALCIAGRRAKRRGSPCSKAATALLLFFALYLIGVYHVTGVGTLYDGLRFQWEINPWQINLLPFSNHIDLVGYGLNVVLFLPLGFLSPLLWRGQRHIAGALGTGLAFSLLIEVSQLLNNRSTDVDDLILNTLGALVGFLLYRACAYILRRNPTPSLASPAMGSLLCVGVTFLGRFLLFNDMGMARLLYGF